MFSIEIMSLMLDVGGSDVSSTPRTSMGGCRKYKSGVSLTDDHQIMAGRCCEEGSTDTRMRIRLEVHCPLIDLNLGC